MSAHIFSDSKNLNKLKYLGNVEQNFALTVSADETKNILVTLNGIYPVVRVNVNKFIDSKIA